jgi:hypothetical protein
VAVHEVPGSDLFFRGYPNIFHIMKIIPDLYIILRIFVQ